VSIKPAFIELMAARRAELRAKIGAIFPAPQAIVWEIGCGHGHFLERYAAEFPQRLCLGVDLASERITRALRKSERGKLLNCHFIRADALEFLHALPKGVTLQEIWVLFPDPWPKKRHHKNRILQSDFFAALASWAPTGARLYFRTDSIDYFKAVEALLPSLITWQVAEAGEPWPLEHETVFQARAESYQSLILVRTPHRAKSAEITAPEVPPREDSKLPA
jgi:tRNA (guanine-N7-)-methyltransferase